MDWIQQGSREEDTTFNTRDRPVGGGRELAQDPIAQFSEMPCFTWDVDLNHSCSRLQPLRPDPPET